MIIIFIFRLSTDVVGRAKKMSWVAEEVILGFKFYRDNAEFMVLRVWLKSLGVKKFQTKADRRQLALK